MSDLSATDLEIHKNLMAWMETVNIQMEWQTFRDSIASGAKPPSDSCIWRFLNALVTTYKSEILADSHIKLYRARCVSPSNYNKLHISDSIDGFNKDQSGAPPATADIPAGRANPKGTSYLYLASDPATACAEVQAYPSQWIFSQHCEFLPLFPCRNAL